MDLLERLQAGLASPDQGQRLAALALVASKAAGSIEQKSFDKAVVPLLTQALSDSNLRVRRYAAMALRPFVQAQPNLLDSILPGYAIHSFNGRYTHVGLLDVRSLQIWIPPYQAKGGHAALIADGTTDRYFKFDFSVPGQAPPNYRQQPGGAEAGHLTMHFIADWHYARQDLIAAFDQRRLAANIAQQNGLARKVISFYRDCGLAYPVLVHHLTMQQNARPKRALYVERIEAHLPGNG